MSRTSADGRDGEVDLVEGREREVLARVVAALLLLRDEDVLRDDLGEVRVAIPRRLPLSAA